MLAGALLIFARGLVAPSAIAQAPAPQSRINQGRSLFGEQCASCHGADARGLNGPTLTNLFTSGNDDRVVQIIRNGVPGSIMAASRNTDDEIRAIVGYLKVLASPPPSSAAYVRPNPNADLVTLTTNDGRVIHGERKNEDAFSIQIAEGGGRLQGYFKSSLKNIVRGERAPAAKTEPSPGVTYRDILGGLKDPSRWVTFSGDYSGQRHSPLTGINPGNVAGLRHEWTFQTGTTTRGRGFEATPLLWDNVLYVTGSNNYAWALDARTGRPFWTYRRDLPADLTYGAQAPVNRGFGLLDHRLFMVTLDAHLLAFDRATGRILVGHRARRLQDRLRRHARAARHRRQGDRRHFRRRVSDERVP